jgi:hypothetical protein
MAPDSSEAAQREDAPVVVRNPPISNLLALFNDRSLGMTRREHFLAHHLASVCHELEQSQDPDLGIRLFTR